MLDGLTLSLNLPSMQRLGKKKVFSELYELIISKQESQNSGVAFFFFIKFLRVFLIGDEA